MDLLALVNVPIEVFFAELIEIDFVKQLAEYYRQPQRISPPKNTFVYHLVVAQRESALMFFVFCYLHHIQLSSRLTRPEAATDYWRSILKFVDLFKVSSNPQTLFWLFEIVFMCTRKVNPKLVYSVDREVKRGLHRYIKDMLIKFAKFSVRE